MDDDVDVTGNSDESSSNLGSNDSHLFKNATGINCALNLSERNYWSFEEKQLFEIGYEQFGNKWSKVAQLIGSKSACQARNYFKRLHVPVLKSEKPNEEYNNSFSSPNEITRIKKTEDDLEEVDIGFDSGQGSSFSHGKSESKEEINNSLDGIKSNHSEVAEKRSVEILGLEAHEMIITDEEKQIHSEFFTGTGKKSPGRYLRIRSHIIRAWTKNKPHYLSKGAARAGLNNCGDVNSIGKIHSYLEKIGLININCVMQKRKVDEKKNKTNSFILSQNYQTMSLRKRKALADKFEDEDMKDKGLTIEHGEDGSEINRLVIEKRAKTTKPNNNPFQLVPCHRFNSSKIAPFELFADLRALFLAETHSYLFESEVIGLLGGQFSSEKCQLEIECAVPCNSLSSGVECEMDPVSQSEASEFIRSQGFKVVGWYHSHPTFEPNPSLRDLETQYKYQEMFQSQSQQPFISLIISPFIRGAPASKLCWWFIGNDKNKPDSTNLEPYEISFRLTAKWELKYVLAKIEKVFQTDRDSRQRIKKIDTDKLINTLRLHSIKAGIQEDVLEPIVTEIRKILNG